MLCRAGTRYVPRPITPGKLFTNGDGRDHPTYRTRFNVVRFYMTSVCGCCESTTLHTHRTMQTRPPLSESAGTCRSSFLYLVPGHQATKHGRSMTSAYVEREKLPGTRYQLSSKIIRVCSVRCVPYKYQRRFASETGKHSSAHQRTQPTKFRKQNKARQSIFE